MNARTKQINYCVSLQHLYRVRYIKPYGVVLAAGWFGSSLRFIKLSELSLGIHRQKLQSRVTPLYIIIILISYTLCRMTLVSWWCTKKSFRFRMVSRIRISETSRGRMEAPSIVITSKGISANEGTVSV